MQKVVYSITKAGRNENKKTGVGFITKEDLIIACLSQKGKPYVRVFEDCVKHCHPLLDDKNEFKGTFYEIREVEFERKDGGKESREIEITYYIWYRLAD